MDLLGKFKEGVKRQDKVNAVIKYINNDFLDRGRIMARFIC